MKSLSLEEESITKYIRNHFRLEKQLNYTTIKNSNRVTFERNGDRNESVSFEES